MSTHVAEPTRPRALAACQRGFTLPELMMTMSLMGLMLSIGVPGLDNLTQSHRVSAQANELIGALQLARSEAIRRGVAVSVTADDGDFADGWCVHLEDDCEGGNALRVYPAPARLGLSQNATTIQFDARGARLLPGADTDIAEITVQPDRCEDGTAERARVVAVGLSGRTSVTRSDCS
jgi:type IV fimbrial biogenesis protein FimT